MADEELDARLPPYFQKYLDAKFQSTTNEIVAITNEVRIMVASVQKQLDEFKEDQRASSVKWGGGAGAIVLLLLEILRKQLGIGP